jgi:hypothetical protein
MRGTGAEHDKLKEDFRTLVRLQDDDEPSHGEVTQKTKSVPNIPNLLLIGRSNRNGSADRKPSVVGNNLFQMQIFENKLIFPEKKISR